MNIQKLLINGENRGGPKKNINSMINLGAELFDHQR